MTAPHAPAERRVVALVGNPRAGSRTLTAAEALARRVATEIGASDVAAIDLAGLAGEIFAPEHPGADGARDRAAGADVLVVATPVYKASYTGLLKSFLDLYGPDGLAGVVAIPLVVSGSPAHGLIGEVHLRPVLVELGATVPTRSFAVTESRLGEIDEAIATWLAREGGALRRSVGLADVPGEGVAGAVAAAGAVESERVPAEAVAR